MDASFGAPSTAQSIWHQDIGRKKASSSLASMEKYEPRKTAISALLATNVNASTIHSDVDPYNIGDSIIS